jgi:hypothetical protein
MLAIGGIMLVPPLTALVANGERQSPRAVGFFWFVVAVGAIGMALTAPAYTSERPQRRLARYVQDDMRGEAWWEVAGPEGGLGIDESQLPNARWERTTKPPVRAEGRALAPPFAYRAATTRQMNAPPADVKARWIDGSDGSPIFEITIVPRDAVSARIVLPPGVVPASTTLAGAVTDTQWTGTYFAIPTSGLVARFTFPGSTRAALDDTTVVLFMAGLPGGRGPYRLPGWLQTDTAFWQARTVVIVTAKPQ